MKTLHAESLAKSYGNRQIVKDVSMSVNSGQIVGLLGPQWCWQNHLFLYDCESGAGG